MARLTFIILGVLLVNIVNGQKKIDYLRADVYIQKSMGMNVSVDELNQIEDSIFVNRPVHPMNPQYLTAFKNYFLLRSYNRNYIRNEKNKSIEKTKENILPFLVREGGEMKTAPLGHLAFLTSYEFAYEAGYISSKEFIDTIRKVREYTRKREIRKYCKYLMDSNGWTT